MKKTVLFVICAIISTTMLGCSNGTQISPDMATYQIGDKTYNFDTKLTQLIDDNSFEYQEYFDSEIPPDCFDTVSTKNTINAMKITIKNNTEAPLSYMEGDIIDISISEKYSTPLDKVSILGFTLNASLADFTNQFGEPSETLKVTMSSPDEQDTIYYWNSLRAEELDYKFNLQIMCFQENVHTIKVILNK